MFSPVGREHSDIICFFLMYHGEGSKKMLCGCTSMHGCFALSDIFHNSFAEFGENHHIAELKEINRLQMQPFHCERERMMRQ